MSPFLHDRMVPRPRNTSLPRVIPGFVAALRVEHHEIVHHDAVAEADLVGMPQDDALAERRRRAPTEPRSSG